MAVAWEALPMTDQPGLHATATAEILIDEHVGNDNVVANLEAFRDAIALAITAAYEEGAAAGRILGKG
jgi:hypothetical protein